MLIFLLFFFNDTSSSDIYTLSLFYSLLFFFNDTATTEIYTLSLHDALPISSSRSLDSDAPGRRDSWRFVGPERIPQPLLWYGTRLVLPRLSVCNVWSFGLH